MANPAEIEVAVTAQIDQLQQALQQAEEAIKRQAAKIESIEDRKAKAAEQAQQRAIAAEQKKAAQIEAAAAKAEQRAQQEAQRAVQIEQKKQAQLEALRVKEQQRAAALLQRQTEVRQKQALKEIQAQQQAAAQAGGGAFNPLAGLGAVAKAGGVLAITNLLLNSSQAAADAFAKGAGARGVAEAFVTGLYDAIKAVPIAGQITTLFDTLFYGSTREAERKAEEIANAMTAKLDKAIAENAQKSKATQELAQSTADRLKRGTATDKEQAEFEIRTDALRKQIAEQTKIEDDYFKASADKQKSADDVTMAIALGNMKLARERRAELFKALEVEEELERRRKDAILQEQKQLRLEKERAEIAKKNADQAAAEEDKLKRLVAFNKEMIRSKADVATAAKQKELDKLTRVTSADRQAQMMQSAQSSAASMMGSVGTALGEFKFAQKGLGDMALAEAKKQTEKQIKIEQLQADMKAIQQEMLRKLDSMSIGVS
jgi:hypothetical protein